MLIRTIAAATCFALFLAASVAAQTTSPLPTFSVTVVESGSVAEAIGEIDVLERKALDERHARTPYEKPYAMPQPGREAYVRFSTRF